MRSWVEQSKLLKQRAEILGRSVLPQSLLNDKDVAEALQEVCANVASISLLSTNPLPAHGNLLTCVMQVLEEGQALERARMREAKEACKGLGRAAELTRSFRSLVSYVAPGRDFLEELTQVMHAAEAALVGERERHEKALQQLGSEQGMLEAQLEAFEERGTRLPLCRLSQIHN